MNRFRKVFIDTSFFIALANRDDMVHPRAKSLQAEFRRTKSKKITTEHILFEVGDGLSRLKFRQLAIDIILTVLKDDTFEVVPSSSVLFQSAIDLYCNRADKEWELTDCSSFVVMRQKGIQVAASTDKHFQQAGFRALLLEKESG